MTISLPSRLGAVETPGGFEFAPGTTYSMAASLSPPSAAGAYTRASGSETSTTLSSTSPLLK
jgi:hypothetical protein